MQACDRNARSKSTLTLLESNSVSPFAVTVRALAHRVIPAAMAQSTQGS